MKNRDSKRANGLRSLHTLAHLATLGLILTFLAGCPPPPPAAPATTATSGSYTVSVTAVGPTKWTYVVSTTGASNINYVEFILPLNVNSVTVTKPAGWTSNTAGGSIVLTSATGAITQTFDLEIDKNNGPVYVIVQPISGGAKTTLGPVAGPT
ncbi:hypothetical protein [Pelagicoccus sp. SDUM812005]|uniref:hypothetical protein n=1 Tax=Pelagicoccus sp. SDUM812005 TaxID=3041257 RepID=UPI00280CCFE9|nr:hypothetical protein [Pelagicoccus sp. SDUM812005]MDQ8182600.1 hypothetical protein [Pelagicoccus sp. SDUM812005]